MLNKLNNSIPTTLPYPPLYAVPDRTGTTAHHVPAGRALYAVPDRTVPIDGHVPAGRALHLLDIENLMGGPFAGINAMARAARSYFELAAVGANDHVIVGVNPALVFDVASVMPAVRTVVGGGPDGADLALLRSVEDVGFIGSLYQRIVFGTGDHVFTAKAREFSSLGLVVGVVSRCGSLSYALSNEATYVAVMDDPAARRDIAS